VRPNILLILSDDQPFYTMDYMSKALAHLSLGLEFTTSYVGSPLCSPSRASIHTGLYPHNHGVKENKGAAKRFRSLRLQDISLGALLQRQGYRCGYLGKVLNGYDETAAWEMPGYDEWTAVLTNRSPVRANLNGRVKKTTTARKNETSWLATRARGFIEDALEPWFCFASVKAPHSPYDPSDAHKNDFPDLTLPGRENFNHLDENKPKEVRELSGLNESEQSTLQSIYRGKMRELMDLDDAIDSLCSVVDFETTYVFFLTDNGFMLGEHRIHAKGVPYEEATRTPLFVRGPGMRESATTDLLASAVDIAPTIAELAGLDPGPDGLDMDGRSLVGPMFEPAEDNLTWRDSLLLEMPSSKEFGKGWSAIRSSASDSLYVEHDTGERELYDMQEDPYQLSNVAAEADSAVISEMSMKLHPMREAGGESLRAAEAS